MGDNNNPKNVASEPPRFQGLLSNRRQTKATRLMKRTINTALCVGKPDPHVTPGVINRATPLMAGIIVAAISGVASIYSLINPAGDVGKTPLIIDRETHQLFVNNPNTNKLYPVYNLTSARLILGKPEKPKPVAHTNIIKHTITHEIGIPNAPTIPATQPQPQETNTQLCQAAGGGQNINNVIFYNGEITDPNESNILEDHFMVFVHDKTWWFISGKGRSRLENDATTLLPLGITSYDLAQATPIGDAVFNSIPELPPLSTPLLPQFGEPSNQNIAGLPEPPAIGTIFTSQWRETKQTFLVLAEGIQPIPKIVAEMLRNKDRLGLDTIPVIDATELPHQRIVNDYYFDNYPQKTPEIVYSKKYPILCYHWKYLPEDTAATTTISAHTTQQHNIEQENIQTRPANAQNNSYITHYISGEGPSNYVYAIPDIGKPPETGPTWWINESGQRYQITQKEIIKQDQKNKPTTGTDTKIAEHIGITTRPMPMPAALINALTPGLPQNQSLTPEYAARTYPNTPAT